MGSSTTEGGAVDRNDEKPSQAEGEDPDRPGQGEAQPTGKPSQAEGEDPAPQT
jgi:hypothetical protein